MEEVRVDGRQMTWALAEFEAACLRLIADEIYTFDPDMLLVDLLEEAVRLARQYADVCQ